MKNFIKLITLSIIAIGLTQPIKAMRYVKVAEQATKTMIKPRIGAIAALAQYQPRYYSQTKLFVPQAATFTAPQRAYHASTTTTSWFSGFSQWRKEKAEEYSQEKLEEYSRIQANVIYKKLDKVFQSQPVNFDEVSRLLKSFPTSLLNEPRSIYEEKSGNWITTNQTILKHILFNPMRNRYNRGRSDSELITILLEAGANPNCNPSGYYNLANYEPSALNIAIKTINLEAVRLLLKHGAEVTSSDFETLGFKQERAHLLQSLLNQDLQSIDYEIGFRGRGEGFNLISKGKGYRIQRGTEVPILVNQRFELIENLNNIKKDIQALESIHLLLSEKNQTYSRPSNQKRQEFKKTNGISPYSVLEIAENASDADILGLDNKQLSDKSAVKTAFIKQVQKWHPDKSSTIFEQEKFKTLSPAQKESLANQVFILILGAYERNK